ncbi:unnamed protein product [Symbiodinium natans]|uniref:Uncharacterized protein n=1 Tax=Symbiodinium natans TaxID=878477 RepID=A0A812NFD6_9DINO|nr:unnamed protein product [Symbiodinium natans]
MNKAIAVAHKACKSQKWRKENGNLTMHQSLVAITIFLPSDWTTLAAVSYVQEQLRKVPECQSKSCFSTSWKKQLKSWSCRANQRRCSNGRFFAKRAVSASLVPQSFEIAIRQNSVEYLRDVGLDTGMSPRGLDRDHEASHTCLGLCSDTSVRARCSPRKSTSSKWCQRLQA